MATERVRCWRQTDDARSSKRRPQPGETWIYRRWESPQTRAAKTDSMASAAGIEMQARKRRVKPEPPPMRHAPTDAPRTNPAAAAAFAPPARGKAAIPPSGSMASRGRSAPAAANEQEAALVEEFYTSRLVVEALDARKVSQMGRQGGLRSSRQATTMAAILRRWFIGKQTVKKATEKTASLPPRLSGREFGLNNALVGTAALLELQASSNPAQSRLVTVADAPGAPGYMVMTLGVATNKRGRPVAASPTSDPQRCLLYRAPCF